MKNRKAITIIAALIICLLIISGKFSDWNDSPSSSGESVENGFSVNQEKQISSDESRENKDYKFRKNSLLESHYEKHGIDMGFSSAKEYEKAASDVINNPEALTKIEKEDGDYVYYIEETNELVILSTDGYVRTYFKPDSGKKYFDKQ